MKQYKSKNTSMAQYISTNASMDPYLKADGNVDPNLKVNTTMFPYLKANTALDPYLTLDTSMNQQIYTNTSQNQNTNATYLYYGLPTVITLSTVLAISMILAVVGNMMVILTIARHRAMRTRTNILLANLAVADILVAVLDMPIAIITLVNGNWVFSDTFCYFNGFTVGLGLMVSVHTLMCISIHKFISITRPFSGTMTPTKIVVALVITWTWPILFNLAPLFGWTDSIYKPGSSQCGPPAPKLMKQQIHAAVNTMANLVIPFIVMFYCYYRIFKEVRDHLNRMQDFADTNVRNSLIQQRRITMTLCIVLFLFLLFWMPYIFYSLSLVFFGQKNVWDIFNPISYMCGYMNSACNPIIYALRSPSFRRSFKNICQNHRGTSVTDRSQFERETTSYIGGMMVSFRRSIWRRNRMDTIQRLKERTQLRANAQVNGDRPRKFVSRLSCNLLENTNKPNLSSEPHSANITVNRNLNERGEYCASTECSLGLCIELDGNTTPKVDGSIGRNLVNDLTCKSALCNSSPTILESLDTENGACTNEEPLLGLIPLIKHELVGSLDKDDCESNSRCSRVSVCSMGQNTLEVTARSLSQTNLSLPWNSLDVQKAISYNNLEIIHTTPNVMKSWKSASAGDVTTLQQLTRLDDSPQPKRRNKSDTKHPLYLEWQASVDTLYESQEFSWRKRRFPVHNINPKHKPIRTNVNENTDYYRKKNIGSHGNHKHLRVATMINNMKRSLSDMFHGEDELPQNNQTSVTFPMSGGAEGNT